MPDLRLFIAIELPPPVRDALRAAIDDLRAAGATDGLRYVRPEGVHLTLKFLGATPESRVPAIAEGLRRAAAGIAPFDLQPEGFGAFHGGRHMPHEFRGSRESYHYNIRVIWVGLAGDVDALASLAERVEREIEPLGYPREKRAFFPHLTLARVRDDADRPTRERIYEAVCPLLSKSSRSADYRPELVRTFPSFRADHLALMRSTLAPGGALYDEVETFPLTRS